MCFINLSGYNEHLFLRQKAGNHEYYKTLFLQGKSQSEWTLPIFHLPSEFQSFQVSTGSNENSSFLPKSQAGPWNWLRLFPEGVWLKTFISAKPSSSQLMPVHALMDLLMLSECGIINICGLCPWFLAQSYSNSWHFIVIGVWFVSHILILSFSLLLS